MCSLFEQVQGVQLWDAVQPEDHQEAREERPLPLPPALPGSPQRILRSAPGFIFPRMRNLLSFEAISDNVLVLSTLDRTFRQPVQKKYSAAEHKTRSLCNFPFFEGIWAYEKHFFCLCEK